MLLVDDRILQMYNKHGYSFMSKPQVDTFDEIPQEWFRKHEKELTKAGFTIHMHYI